LAHFALGRLWAGLLGGLIGLGGTEFRLPLLIGSFRIAALEAVILNKERARAGQACAITALAEIMGEGRDEAETSPVSLN
jgi:hypothetical protein